MNTELAFKQANILDESGRLTNYAIEKATYAMGKDSILSNPSVIESLTKNGSRIEDWGKFTTPSVELPSGQRVQIHFYKNIITNEVNYEHSDYKVKGVVNPLNQKPTPEPKVI